jgi:signal transduction histidine kinase
MEQKSTILVVDDEPMAHDIIEGYLFREGYELAFATSGLEALTFLDQQLPDVILLDVMMPDMDGLEVCQQLKTSERFRHIPIILITALGSKEDLASGIEAGADDFLAKPVNDLELRARVRSLLRIKKQYDELQAALRLREDLARMIVHDMRTPLTAILGFSDLLQFKGNLSAEDLEEVKMISNNALRLNSFLNDMLIVAKMEEAGQLILNRTLADVNHLVRQVHEDQALVASLKKINIELDLPSESRPVSLDANLFQRVLDNLLSNAVKFSPVESTVIVRVDYPEATSEPLPAEAKLRIRVLDEGPGIDQEHRDRIFDKFEVVELKRSDTRQIGLGLVFCKMVVEAHQGRIFVEDNMPAGSVFTVEI